MTDRKFTPPTEFPAEYVTRDGCRAAILGLTPCDTHPLAGYVQDEFGHVTLCNWAMDGLQIDDVECDSDLHDLPTKHVHWANDYSPDVVSFWYSSRHQADRVADAPSRVAVIRREWVEGQPPQYFTEDL